MLLEYFRRNPNSGHVVGDIVDDGGSGSDDDIPTDFNPLNNTRSDPDVSKRANVNMTRQMSTRRNVYVIHQSSWLNHLSSKTFSKSAKLSMLTWGLQLSLAKTSS